MGLSSVSARVLFAAVELTAELCARLPLDALRENLTSLVVGLYPIIESSADATRSHIHIASSGDGLPIDPGSLDHQSHLAMENLHYISTTWRYGWVESMLKTSKQATSACNFATVPSICRIPRSFSSSFSSSSSSSSSSLSAWPSELLKICETAHVMEIHRLYENKARACATGLIKVTSLLSLHIDLLFSTYYSPY